jgi:dTDP-4-amino-4,6-dideoxygalactose transaminase
MTTGEGGLIATSHDDLAAKMRVLTLHGMSRDAWKRYSSAGSWYYEVIEAGFKYNMTDIQAALGLHQLKRLPGFIEKRVEYAKMYDEAFADMPEIVTPITHEDRIHAYHLYVIQLDNSNLSMDRGEMIEKLKEYNVGTSVHYIPVHIHPYYAKTFGYKKEDLPVTAAAYDRMLSLPLYPKMTKDDMNYVIDVVKYLVSNHRS